ncbi:hypothetical protein [Arundinibacter roseus]|uniref:Lipoprotein n=1 Tax=Arundinibacter roseus TaxID=2070510 RepID=A0A4R4K365_9BACT|nr:hypothetical protein [Arundinibacter roseus]TDB60871.1 hypothetical protein EZE20_20730 [Arundinibacter roseus]
MKKYLSLIALAFTLQGCPTQDKEDPNAALPKEYASCCGVKPVTFEFKTGSIYIPNAFTPNEDGINDEFYPFVSADIHGTIGFSITSAEGDTVLYNRNEFLYDQIKNLAWNGQRPDGTVYRGKFKYSVGVISKGPTKELKIIEGEACSILCEPGTKDLKARKTCFYPSMAAKNKDFGKLDVKLASNEKDCVK